MSVLWQPKTGTNFNGKDGSGFPAVIHAQDARATTSGKSGTGAPTRKLRAPQPITWLTTSGHNS
jgi:hypothetical protein